MTKTIVSLDKIQPIILERLELTNLRHVLESTRELKLKITPVPDYIWGEEGEEAARAAQTFEKQPGMRGTVISATKQMLLQLVAQKINDIDAKLREYGIGNP
jgi:hypothetical protein